MLPSDPIMRAAALGERHRIAAALDVEADVTPCAEDAAVMRNAAKLVRADFSYALAFDGDPAA